MFRVGNVIDLQRIGSPPAGGIVGIQGNVSITAIGHNGVATGKVSGNRKFTRIVGTRNIVDMHGAPRPDKKHVIIIKDGLDIETELHILEGHRTRMRRIGDIDDLQCRMVHRIKAVADYRETGHGTALPFATSALRRHTAVGTAAARRGRQGQCRTNRN